MIFEVNKSVEEVQNAYKAACKLTGVQFNHNEDYTGLGLGRGSWSTGTKYQIATEYEQGGMHRETVDILKEYEGFDEHYHEDEHYNGQWYILTNFEDFWWWFVQLADPTIEYKKIDNAIPAINGYWNKNLNVQFGYGLFC